MKKIVEWVAYLSLTVAALTASYVLIDQKLAQRRYATPLVPAALLNKQLPLEGNNWKEAHYTIVVAMTTVCHFCKDSLPFYKDLGKLEKDKPGQFQMVAVSPEEPETTRKYLSENQVFFNRVESAELASIDVTGTPTVFILDSDGMVRKVYLGKLHAAQQQELIAYVTKTS